MDDLPALPEETQLMNEIKHAMKESSAAGAKKIQEYLEKLNNTPLNIGVTGESGAGKSTFINAFRGIKTSDERAAPVGCTKTTMEVKQYAHPTHPSIILWDMPGIGTMKFPASKYLKQVGFERFDFFIIISAGRFRENDVKIALEIQKMEKKFYFVRSKIDHSLCDAEEDESDFTEERTLRTIKEDCLQNLQKLGFQSPQVFLISSRKLHLYDFPHLHDTLERTLSAHKRHVLLLGMPIINSDIIEKKKEAFQYQIKYMATLSGAVALVPVPGLSAGVDLGLITSYVRKYQVGFGLDKTSLKNLSQTTHVPLRELEQVMTSPLAGKNISASVLKDILINSATHVVLITIEEGLRFLPVFSFVSGVVSFVSTYQSLRFFLNMLAEDAKNVFKKALGLNTSV
ncbi:interferon-inducible GTPase 5-like [Thalassophryne amazonica]|uniref:interferon-inducible GTPase 5-like n=1 Tax=Thalassophryne amazonica TaxID=390379 RepID=UPI0014717405|nr:interferon-inducible GTPase 5-like [Thalassophryne amazonica]